MTEEDVIKVDITPTTKVYSYFENLNYRQESAYAEFIDNSIQSFIDHRDDLSSVMGDNPCRITISHKNNVITVIDNAYGMDLKDFKRAIIINSIPENRTGRNEFGMGLKTAASWFGKKWTVKTTRFGDTNEYTATIDTELFAQNEESMIDAVITQVPAEDHYTIITIENLNRSIPIKKSMGVLKATLGGIYRRDINSNVVEIIYNDDTLQYKYPPILETIEDGKPYEWKKTLDYDLEYKEKKYHVKGFVAIRQTGSSKYAGFTLFRRGRVVVGGLMDTYKPYDIFGQAQSFESQRLFGEFDLDDFPIAQAKNQLMWDDELENLFVQSVKTRIADLKKKSNKYRARKEKNKDSSEETETEVTDDSGNTSSGFTPSSNGNSDTGAGVLGVDLLSNPNTSDGNQEPALVSSSGSDNNSYGSSSNPDDYARSDNQSTAHSPSTSNHLESGLVDHQIVPVDLDKHRFFTLQYNEVEYSFEIFFGSNSISSNLYSKNTKGNTFRILFNKDNHLVSSCTDKHTLDSLIHMVIYITLAEKIVESEGSGSQILSSSIRDCINLISDLKINEV